MNEVTPYERLGGEDGVRRLVDRFYDRMDADASAAGIRQLHAKSLRASRDKLFMFLSGWLGGPDLYVQQYGHPRLRMRHLPFPIGIAERDQWMACMRHALDDPSVAEDLRPKLVQAFQTTADHMRNRPEHTAEPAFGIIPAKS